MVITQRKFRFKNHKREVLEVVVEELKNKNKRIYNKKLSGGKI